METNSEAKPCCSFCHKSQDDVTRLVSNSASYSPRAYICDECIFVGSSILADHPAGKSGDEGPEANGS
jgi:ATP-dependent protease Clp ATPase subunit